MSESQHGASSGRWDGWGDPRRQTPSPDALLRLLGAEVGLRPRPTPAIAAEKARLRPSALPRPVRAALASVVGAGQVRDDRASRLARAGGQGYLEVLRRRRGEADEAPDAVVSPGGHGEVVAVLRACAAAGVAVIPWGGGTSVAGGVEPERHGLAAAIALDLRRMDRLVSVDQVSRVVVAEAGLSLAGAESLLAEHGLTLGHRPDSFEFATLGGCAATRSAGRASGGLGRFDQLVRGLRVATPAGTLDVGRGPASAAGPDLRELFLGSEGALGVITQLSLRARPVPEERRHEAWSFASFADGLAALRRLVQADAAPDTVWLGDPASTRIFLADLPDGLSRWQRVCLRSRGRAPGVLLALGWEAAISGLEDRRRAANPLLREEGGVFLGLALGEAWDQARFAGPYLRDALIGQGVLAETLDTATEWSRWPELYEAVRQALRASLADQGTPPLIACDVSNVYSDGVALRFTVLAARREGTAEDEEEQWLSAKCAAGDAIAERRASATHSFGVGRDHLPWTRQDLGELGVEALRALKTRLDPAGVLNPGKLIPPV